jgi:ribosomal protein S18 acetylase RimI-like enzyme
MRLVSLHAKDEIVGVLGRDPALHIYTLGDLDDFFWPYTTWYGFVDDSTIEAVVLLYHATQVPTLLALTEKPSAAMETLLRSVKRLLPKQIYAHLNPEYLPLLSSHYHVESHGLHRRMVLGNPAPVAAVDTRECVPLSATDLHEIQRLYAASYPGNWFDPRMLETGYYYGIRRNGELATVAGVHVYAPQYGVAALGNITTHPAFRGQGLATTVTAKVCQALLPTVDYIGLNVHLDNAGAIASYTKLGFEDIMVFEECMLTLKHLS